jgi:hypothetical protein
MIDKNKIRREIAKVQNENRFLNKEFFKYSDGYNSGYIKALERLLKGDYDL